MYIPARDHESSAKERRPVFASPENYPRYVGKLRCAAPAHGVASDCSAHTLRDGVHRGIPAYFPGPNQTEMQPLGYVEQVSERVRRSFPFLCW